MPIYLEREYSGDQAWESFVRATPRQGASTPLVDHLQELLGGKADLAIVSYAILGDGALDWVRAPQEMLDGLRPVDCAIGGPLERRLRTMLMQMPV